ncbi:hypothetical protein Moror_9164 [Moniliophthora roreri MCA 2997]|uniref:DDE Tnp4 domain-containing protein n=1 Tax=Moniliophthora roreri (strain MCA 2997) TaxID=1381753 RepID=V2WH01_MONRO|nr:hypothetical protein Moror_9164 [Moniliophthora roreri MCA 2997]
MPRLTDHQQATEVLFRAFLGAVIAEAEAAVLKESEDWDIDSDGSNSDSSSSGTTSSSNTTSSSSGAHSTSPPPGVWNQFDLSMDEEDSDDESEPLLPTTSEQILQALAALHRTRYLQSRTNTIKKSRAQLLLLLHVWKYERPDVFRSYLQMTPACFDKLVETIGEDPAFTNNAHNDQMPPEEQIAIALYCFGHYGNAASTIKVALWAGVGYGTVDLCTKWVMLACLSYAFRQSALHWPDQTQKEGAMQWVEDRSCPGWHFGWLMVDGTLIPLYARPGLYGNTYFDRKANYSLNVQLVNTPDLRIIDFAVGLPGSQHDATAWQETHIYQEHKELLEKREFIWADSAYPLRDWCQAPYKAPEKDTPENTKYNYHVSNVRIQSEHCVGFIKGQFSSLHGLRLRIDNDQTKQFASYWVHTCIVLHSFCMLHEENIDLS